MKAHSLRGLPDREELQALAEKLNHNGLRKMLRGEGWDPMEDDD
jgi:hypothetical protein